MSVRLTLTLPPDSENVCAVVVSYYSDTVQLHSLLQRLAPQVAHVCLVVNGATPEDQKQLMQWQEDSSNTLSVHMNDRNNLARAYNIGIKVSEAHRAHWVLFLDDDSLPEETMVARMATAWQHHPQAQTVGIIGPQVFDAPTREPLPYLVPYGPLFRRCSSATLRPTQPVLSVISSGSMIACEVLRHIGTMHEPYNIDYVDKEFCLRAYTAGYRIMVVRDTRLIHHLGNRRVHHVAGLAMIGTHHVAQRRYTIYRNRLRTLARYGWRVPAFASHECLSMLYDVLRILLFEDDKIKKLGAIVRGMATSACRERAPTAISPENRPETS